MKLVLKNTESFTNSRLNVFTKEKPCLDSAWHYHPEFELLYISRSTGIRFVGDSVSPFEPGDLVLVGSNLPHLWRNDVSYYSEGSEKTVKTVVIKFYKNFIGENTFDTPEFTAINRMLSDSKYGISFGKNVSDSMKGELIGLPGLSNTEQYIKLLDILHRLSIVSDKQLLSSSDMRQYTPKGAHRIDRVLRYISDNYGKTIALEDVSDIACMTPNSFCRFFKKKTNKSFTEFLNEVRIRNASRILVQETFAVNDVCFLVGYNSITNFNKQFKRIMGSTPKQYREAV
ncbi:AraC family transcriptional regulator [Hyunsoonleella sp. SJ7]|uniref:AraC family transcriptional regulator n=1 Tax=Hyunsoonleella aquatilis TaxID=2762758 RepID=A0A923HH13_9FLAO|nr:AraC family transcriptional regulator [Hyunsoonleella aquatilis]MBC3759210.1 AraC family transcriptional regulator [Hyunsoonleella aquatilis]